MLQSPKNVHKSGFIGNKMALRTLLVQPKYCTYSDIFFDKFQKPLSKGFFIVKCMSLYCNYGR